MIIEEINEAVQRYADLSTAQRDRIEFIERGLLQRTFLVRDINAVTRSDFAMLYKNRLMVQTFFGLFGYTLTIDREAGVARLSCEKEAQTTRVPLSGKPALLLCVIWTIYRDRMVSGAMSRILRTTTAEILMELEKYRIRTQFPGTAYAAAAKELRRYNLIGFEGEPTLGTSEILLYPSLQFCMDESAFRAYVDSISEDRLKRNHTEMEEEAEEDSDYE